MPGVFLSQEISNFHLRTVIGDGYVDWEMGIHCTHFVHEALKEKTET